MSKVPRGEEKNTLKVVMKK